MTEPEAEAPLDPAMEKVRRKMVRLLAVSIGIMFVGLMAVLSAVVYRINSDTASVGAEVPIALPEGAEIRETSLGDDRLALRVSTPAGAGGAGEAILVYDLATGTLLSTHPIAVGP